MNNVYRLSIGQYNNGQSSTNNQTAMNSAGTGAVVLNSTTNSGTGGVIFGSGGASPSTVATVDNAGNAHYNGTLQVGGTSQSTGTMTVRNNADTEVDYYLWPGLTTSQKGSFTYKDWNGNSQWYLVKDSSNNWALNSALGGLDSFKAYQSTNSGDTYINASNLSGHIRLNYETGSGAETDIYSGTSANLVASFLGPTSVKLPGLAAGSGHNCLQIDNSGYITNTGIACGSGNGNGTVSSGTSGQIAYYTTSGTSIAGTSAVPLTAGGTGSTSAAGAVANLLPGMASDGNNGFVVTGNVTALTATTDTKRNGTHWFDVRAKGAICNNTADDTAAFQSVLASANQSLIELPHQSCMINPGPSSGPSALIIPYAQQDVRIIGLQGQWGSVLFDKNTNSSDAPLLTIGDGTNWLEGGDLEEFQLRGGSNDCYPNGLLRYANEVNLSTSYNIKIQTTGTYATPCTIIGLTNAGPLWQEMKFYEFGIFGPSSLATLTPSVASTGILLTSQGSNTDLVNPNVENWQTGINFRGSSGSPMLNITGGHMERIGNYALNIDQAQVNIQGLELQAGAIWLGQGVFGSILNLPVAGKGWASATIDNGLGNKIYRPSTFNSAPGVNTDGSEWYRTGNVVPDQTFNISGSTGWTCTNATVSVTQISAPGAKAGQSLQITPTSAGGYCTQSFPVSASTDYLVGGAFYFNSTDTTAQLQVYDQTCSTLLWDTSSFTASVAISGTDPFGADVDWRFIKTRIPSGAATSFCVRVIAPLASVPTVIAGLFIVPSAMTMTSPTIAGTGSCSGTGAAYACSTAGENNGAATNTISWTTTPQAYGSFLRLVCTTASDSVTPYIRYGYGSSQTTNPIAMQPGTTMEYTVPLGAFAAYVEILDYSGPTTDPSDISCTSLTVNPIYQNQMIGIANPSDNNLVQYVDQQGVQHRTTTGVPQVLCQITAPLLNTATSQTQMNSCTIPGGTIGATGHLSLMTSGSSCTASTSPYSGCTGANAGTCTPQVYLAASNTGATLSMIGGVAVTAAKGWKSQTDIKAQNSTTSQVVNAQMWYGGANLNFTGVYGTLNTANALYLNSFLTNQNSSNVCGYDQLELVYTPN